MRAKASDVVRVEEVDEVSAELLSAIGGLVRQLSSSSPAPGRAELEEVVASEATSLLVARNRDGAVVGTLSLAVFRIPTGIRAWIEDVVVDEGTRGQGVGEALVREALRLAAERGAWTVDLTSGPRREAANRLYRRLGFSERDTNIYRFGG